MYSLVENRDVVNTWMERYGVRFGIYKNGTFREQLLPFDAIPRVISAEDWLRLERGLKQRVEAQPVSIIFWLTFTGPVIS